MAYSDQIVDQVQSLNDIVEIISAYVPLRRTGRSFKANCPFHQEKTPSFIVNPDKQIFHCFGCGVGGDVFSFLMKYEQMTFPEALKRLADRARVSLPEYQKTSPREKSRLERLHQMYASSAQFFHSNLKHPERGKIGRDYLTKRGFELSVIDSFQLGYASAEWRHLYEYLSKQGFGDQELLQSGLVARSAQGKSYDLFRGRVMFPIFNAQGKVVAFGGRVLGDETPKYLNSPETLIFRKRKELYGLYQAKRAIGLSSEIRRILIVEGYLDCIRLQVSGFPGTVATLGTSLTQEHVQILKRYADEAVVVFDGDKAGEQASLRSLDIFLEEGMSLKVLCLPKGFDPDDFVRSKGENAMKELMKEAQDVFDFKLQVLMGRYNKSDSLGLLKITSEFLDTFSKIQSPVLVDRYVKRLAAVLGVEESSLRLELNKLKTKQGSSKISQAASSLSARAPVKSEPPVEKLLLSLVLHYPPYLRTLRDLFPNFAFSGEKTRALFDVLVQVTGDLSESQTSSSRLLNRVTDESLKVFATELLMMEWQSGEDREHAFQEAVRSIRGHERAEQLQVLRTQISKAEETGQQELVLKYMKEYQELLRPKNHIAK